MPRGPACPAGRLAPRIIYSKKFPVTRFGFLIHLSLEDVVTAFLQLRVRWNIILAIRTAFGSEAKMKPFLSRRHGRKYPYV